MIGMLSTKHGPQNIRSIFKTCGSIRRQIQPAQEKYVSSLWLAAVAAKVQILRLLQAVQATRLLDRPVGLLLVVAAVAVAAVQAMLAKSGGSIMGMQGILLTSLRL